MGHVVVLSGEAGIGKSRLVQVLKEYVAGEAHTRWECRCSPYYQHTALYPIIDLLQRALRWQPEDSPEEKLTKLEQMLRQYRLPLEETMPPGPPSCPCHCLRTVILPSPFPHNGTNKKLWKPSWRFCWSKPPAPNPVDRGRPPLGRSDHRRVAQPCGRPGAHDLALSAGDLSA